MPPKGWRKDKSKITQPPPQPKVEDALLLAIGKFQSFIEAQHAVVNSVLDGFLHALSKEEERLHEVFDAKNKRLSVMMSLLENAERDRDQFRNDAKDRLARIRRLTDEREEILRGPRKRG